MNHSALLKIEGFLNLGNGWCYGEGRPCLPSTANNAKQLVVFFLANGFTTIDAFPGINGEVRVTAYTRNDYIEFTFENNGLLTFLQEKNNEEIEYEENLSLSDCYEKIRSLRSLCNLYESFMTNITTKTKNDSKVLLFVTPQKGVSRSSVISAPWSILERYVDTFMTTTPMSSDRQSYSGCSIHPSCQTLTQ
jgi:hypothetical protein